MRRASEAPTTLPEINPTCNEAERSKYALNFYNYTFLLALDDLRNRWYIEATDLTAFNEWGETIMELQEFRRELVYLASLLPSQTYYRFWVILVVLVFSGKVGYLAPHLADWAKDFRGDYNMEVKNDKYGDYLEVRVYAQLTEIDWKELKRAAKSKSRVLEPKTTRKGDDLYMLATLANLARDGSKRFSYGQLAGELLKLGYNDKGGGLFTDDAIEKKLKTAHQLGF